MLFDSTVRRELARSFGATLVVILTIVITMMLIRTLGMAAGGNVAPEDVVLVLGYYALGHLPTMLSLSMFIAVVVTLGRMYRDSEMVIWFASGVGLGRFVRPVLRMAWPVLLAVGLLLLFVWPWGNQAGTELRGRYEQRSDLSRVTPGVFQSSRDGSRVFFIDRASPDGAAGVEGQNVFVLARRDTLESVTSAHRGRLVDVGPQRMLQLDEGQRNDTDSASGVRTLSSFERYRVVVSDAAARSAAERPPKATTTLSLLRNPTPRNQGELAWRFGLLLAAANLLLLGIGLAATQPRRASNWNLLFALLSFVAYFNLINLSQSWVASGRLGMGTALALIHGGVFALALSLIWWRDHATVWRARFSRGGSGRATGACA
ncbi:LPS export ABC transporter permease LptF [Aquabacterium sp. OR-4]|uniref:LPS export ABC transporter permease LptF n=1 Tax=Aquabacterium sp. OR-4 TaxID=2978127 RepID=UPI0021B31BF4|nr:LPS export ABC transporter permease LptF [Aquabacterium sp. OR-4]MDT7834751.1 LPS export ABC transporter permease LptF [Aquabacterium sp. OR-4]